MGQREDDLRRENAVRIVWGAGHKTLVHKREYALVRGGYHLRRVSVGSLPVSEIQSRTRQKGCNGIVIQTKIPVVHESGRTVGRRRGHRA